MKLKITATNDRLQELGITKGQLYEVDEIIGKDYKIQIPMKQINKFRNAIVNNDEAELVEE